MPGKIEDAVAWSLQWGLVYAAYLLQDSGWAVLFLKSFSVRVVTPA